MTEQTTLTHKSEWPLDDCRITLTKCIKLLIKKWWKINQQNKTHCLLHMTPPQNGKSMFFYFSSIPHSLSLVFVYQQWLLFWSPDLPRTWTNPFWMNCKNGISLNKKRSMRVAVVSKFSIVTCTWCSRLVFHHLRISKNAFYIDNVYRKDLACR